MKFDKKLRTNGEKLKGKNFGERSRQLKKFDCFIDNKLYWYLGGRLCESGGDIFVDKKGKKYTITGSEDNYQLWEVY